MGNKSPLFGTLENLEARLSLSASPLVTDATLIDPILNDAATQAAQASLVGSTNSTSTTVGAAAATPYGGKAPVVPANGSVVIEAENYDQGGEGISYHDADAANQGNSYRQDGVDVEASKNGGYNIGWISPGEWTAYTINVEKAGTYTITVRISTPYSGNNFHLEFGAVGQTSGSSITTTGTITATNTSGWQNWTDVTISGVQLQAGTQWMRFVSDNMYANLDKFTVTATGTSTTTGSAVGTAVATAGTTTINAADYDQGGQGVGYNDVDTANRGGQYRTGEGVDIEKSAEGGYDICYVTAGEWTAYSLDFTKSGNYDVTIRVAAPFTSKLHLEIFQNGAWTKLSTVTFGPSGGWQNWTDVKISGVAFSSGSAVLRVVAESETFNYSKITLSPSTTTSSSTATPVTSVPATGTTTIGAADYDKGGQGVGYKDVDNVNSGGQYRTGEGVDVEKCAEGGYNICYVNAGEWTAYSLNLEKSGNYDFTLRVAAPFTSKLHLEIYQNGKWTTLPTVTFGASGGWQNWTDVKISGVALSGGSAVVRVVAESTTFNYSKISLTKQPDPVVKNFTTQTTTVSGYQRLTINGTAGADNFTVSSSNGVLTVTNGNYSETFTGTYGDIVIHGGDGDDVITIQSSVNIATLLYGDAGNDTITALGTGYNIITSIGGGKDTLTGNGINTSFWADEAGTDTVNASTAETNAGRVHRVASFYQPWTTSTTSTDYVSKELLGQELRDPTGSGTNNYTANSLWGAGPSVSDINQGQISDCYLLADLQSAALNSPDKLKETVVDLGDGTYAVQFKRNGVTTYVRVDNDLGGGVYLNKASSGVWAMVIEKAYALFRTGGNSYSSLNYGDTGAAARDMGYTVSYITTIGQTASSLASAIQSALSSGIGLTVSTGSTIKNNAPVATAHAYTVMGTTTSSSGEILFQLRNPWGFDGYGSDGNASDGIVSLTFAQMTANFSTVMKMV